MIDPDEALKQAAQLAADAAVASGNEEGAMILALQMALFAPHVTAPKAEV